MSEERFAAWLKFAQFFLGTIVLGAFSTIISHQIQTREVEIKEQEANAKFLEQALQEDVGVRRRLSQYFAHVTRSSELRERWGEYAKLVEAEYQAALTEKRELQQQAKAPALDPAFRDQLQGRIADLDRQLSPTVTPTATAAASLAPRVYFHIGAEGQRVVAEQTAAILRADSIGVPGIELRANSPSRTELRYFHASERAEAEGLATTIRGMWLGTVVKFVPGFETSTSIRPRHYELWIAASETPHGGKT
jgi:hypothetical protein